jgi:hypothetical protein
MSENLKAAKSSVFENAESLTSQLKKAIEGAS